MIQRFLFTQCSVLVFAACIASSLHGMGDEQEVKNFYFEPEVAAESSDFNLKETVLNTWDKIKEYGRTFNKSNAEEGATTQEDQAASAQETGVGESNADALKGSENTPPAQAPVVEPAQNAVYTWGSKELLLLGGGSALAAVVIGGVTYILYKNGKLATIGKTLKDHPLIAAATAATVMGVIIAIVSSKVIQ